MKTSSFIFPVNHAIKWLFKAGFKDTERRQHKGIIELSYVVIGNITFHIGNDSFPASSGDTVYVSPGITHHVKVSPSTDCEVISVYFNCGRRESTVDFVKKSVRRIFTDSPVFIQSPDVELLDIFHKLEVNSTLDSQEQCWALSIYFQELLLKLERSLSDSQDKTKLTIQSQLYAGKIKEYISDNYMRELSLEKISRHVCLSPNYCATVFRESSGFTIMDYLRRVRIERAKELLVNTSLSVGEIAEKVGYETLFQFSRLFKKYMGIAPTEYRKL